MFEVRAPGPQTSHFMQTTSGTIADVLCVVFSTKSVSSILVVFDSFLVSRSRAFWNPENIASVLYPCKDTFNAKARQVRFDF